MEKTVLIVLGTVLGVLVVINVFVLNYTVFRVLPKRIDASIATATKTQPSSDGDFVPLAATDSCGQNCRKTIVEALSQVDTKIATLAAVKPTVTPKATPITSSSPAPGAKEFFVPMGSGSTTKSDWEDVAGTDVYVDTNNFVGIKTVYFEVSMHIPTKNGTVTARLYNVTDKHPVWYSDVSTDQDKSTFVTAKINLDPGNKQYRVQLKTSLQYNSILDNARIKILTQ